MWPSDPLGDWRERDQRIRVQLTDAACRLEEFFPATSTMRLVLLLLVADLLIALVGIVVFPNVLSTGPQLLLAGLLVAIAGLGALWFASRARARTLVATRVMLASLQTFVDELEANGPERRAQRLEVADWLAVHVPKVVRLLARGEQGDQAAMAEQLRARLEIIASPLRLKG